MRKVLSPQELETLLGSAAEIQRGLHRLHAGDDAVPIYDFRRPDRVSKEQIRSLHFLHDRFARNVSTSLSAFLRSVTDVTIVSVEAASYSEFLMSLADTTAFYAIGLDPLDGLGALELNSNVAFTMIDRMLGGTGQGVAVNRALTEIEQNVVDGVVKHILENLAETWRPIVEVTFRIAGRETRPQMLQVAAPNEAVVLLVFDLKIGDVRGMLNICFPASVIETIGHKLTQGWYRSRREPRPIEQQQLVSNLSRVSVRVTTELASSMSMRQLLALEPDDIVSFGQSLKDALDVCVGGVVKFGGHLVKTDMGTAVEITRMPEE
ncbi:MAG: flagellar motor switch protein FliM [Acidobacteria bacterium]|nr:flagellar motor switch protein FliM [Acidobacteriota bacterium]